MRILQVGKYFPPYQGGIENNTYHCCKELAKDHEVTALVFGSRRKTIIENMDGISIIRAGSFARLFSQELTFEYLSFLQKLKPDLIHLHAPNPVAVASILAVSSRVPIVITHHTDIVKQRVLKPIVNPMYRQILKRAISIILYTHKYGATSTELEGFYDKFKIIPHGTDESPFQINDHMIDQIQYFKKLTNDAPTVSFIGRHVPYKGVDNLILALTHLPDVHALIGGNGPSLKESIKLAEELGVSDRVHFIENVNNFNKGALLRASNVYVLPSINRTESFGQSLVEAQLSKLPTIVGDIETGVSEVTQHNITGLVIKPNHVGALVKAIRTLVDNRSLRITMGEAGYERAMTHYTERVTGPMLRNHFKEIDIALTKKGQKLSDGYAVNFDIG